MKIYRIIPFLAIVLMMQSCATKKLMEEGSSAYNAGDYKQALNSYDQVIESAENRNKKAKPEIYYKAGLAAMELEQTDKARRYLESAEDLEYSKPKLFDSLAKIYKTIDNLSKEIGALEAYHNKFPNGGNITSINHRLFGTYVESENWEKAVNLWPEIEEQAQTDEDLLAGYLIVNKELEKDELADKLADKILKINPNNIKALEWKAKKYFWKAENTYVSEMKAYQKNRTTSQYKKLLKAWDSIWPDFRKSRDYFKKLYKLNPKPEYAKFLGNIYTRMDEKQKANYWYNKAK